MNRSSILLKIWKLGGYYAWFLRVVKDRAALPLGKRIYYIVKGFLPVQCTLYDFDRWGIGSYISERKRMSRIGPINFEHSGVLGNKIVFSELISKYIRVPKSYCRFYKNKVFELSNSGINSFEKLLALIKEAGDESLIIKPIDSHCGIGVHVVAYSACGAFLLDGNKLSERELLGFMAGLNGYYVSEFVRQGAFGRKIYPGTTNTIRILTMIDPETGKAFIAGALHRFGRDSSYPVDNTYRGGIFSLIDLETGALGSSFLYGDGAYHRIDKHPDSGASLVGVIVPHWGKTARTVLDTANLLSFLKYIGWDIVVSDSGEITVLEGNMNADLYSYQVERPLLKDERIRNFYGFHGAIKTKV